MWSEGIAEGTFTKHELLQQFTDNNIKIPDSLLNDFNNWVWKKRKEYNERL